jgi:WD40 repeat protein
VFRTVWALEEYIGNSGDDILKDPVRPIPFIEGFVLHEPITNNLVASENFDLTHQKVVGYYQTFWEAPQAVQKSDSFELKPSANESSDLELIRTQLTSSTRRPPQGRSWRCINRLIPEFSSSEVCSIAFSTDGKLIATRYTNQTVAVWDWINQKVKDSWSFGSKSSRSSIAFTPGGKLVTGILGTYGEPVIKVIDCYTKKQSSLSPMDMHPADCVVAFTSNQQEWVFSGQNKSLDLWNLSEDKHWISYTTTPDCSLYSSVTALAVSPDNLMMAHGDEKGYIHLWSTEVVKLSKRTETSRTPIRAIAFSPNSQIIAVVNQIGEIKFLKVNTLTELQVINAAHPVSTLAFGSKNGMLIASSKHFIYFWDSYNYKLINSIDTTPSETSSIAFSVNSLLATGSKDGTITVWCDN